MILKNDRRLNFFPTKNARRKEKSQIKIVQRAAPHFHFLPGSPPFLPWRKVALGQTETIYLRFSCFISFGIRQ